MEFASTKNIHILCEVKWNILPTMTIFAKIYLYTYSYLARAQQMDTGSWNCMHCGAEQKKNCKRESTQQTAQPENIFKNRFEFGVFLSV